MGHMGAQDAASFGLTWKCITTSTDFSRAPFYSKIPRMSRLLAEGRRADMLVVARRGMKLGFLSYLFGCLCVAVLGDFMLEFLGTDIRLLGPLPWAAFSAAFLLERYSAMHLQLYTISHHVVWHRVYLLGALLCVGAFSACMQGGLLVLGLAIGVGVSEVFCCSLWTPTLSRRYYEYRYWSFDGRVFLPCLGLFLVWILMLLI
jgi:O-antigen/teichoic acid export membrane protein